MKAGIAALLIVVHAARADEVPPQLALAVMLKVITYDAGFKARGEGDFVVAVPFSKGTEGAAKELVTLASGLTLRAINTRMLKFTAVPLSELSGAGASAVLLPQGSTAELARAVVQASAGAKLYTLAFDEALVHEGVLLGVVSNDGKPQVLVNVPSSKHLGVELSPAVLKVARAVQ